MQGGGHLGVRISWGALRLRPSVTVSLVGSPFPLVPLIVLAATDHGATREREAL
jgi:hypothetical protein